MALARIISRSHQCSRELALDLLERGYAVEIVSPDAIPDSLADLELRVEAGSTDILTASVEAHNGDHSASLDFVHHLKAPMVDFKRRPVHEPEPSSSPAVPVLFSVNESLFENPSVRADEPVAEHTDHAELAEPVRAVSQRMPEPTVYAAEIAPIPEVAANSITMPEIGSSPAKEPRPAAKVVFRRSKSARRTELFRRPLGWSWRAAIAFAAVVTVAVALGSGIRRSSIAFLPESGSSARPGDSTNQVEPEPPKPMSMSARLIAAGNGQNPNASASSIPSMPKATLSNSSTPAPTQVVSVVPNLAQNSGKRDVKSARVSKTSSAQNAKPSSSHAAHKVSHGHGDELIARDTITYLDRPDAKPIPVKAVAHHRAHSSKRHGDVVAASTVTYLNGKTPPKADSGK